MMPPTTPLRRWLLVAALTFIVAPLLACGGSGLTTAHDGRWACPSPLPKPYGPGGPVKTYRRICSADGTDCHDVPVYYDEWEQEYGALGGPPFPSPTPYGIKGSTFLLGQRVEIGSFHVTVTATAGAIVDRAGVPAHTQQVYLISIVWLNHTTAPVPINYAERVRLREVRTATGARITADDWALTAPALQAAGRAAPPDRIPPGASSVTVPVIAPVGSPQTVDIDFAFDPNYQPDGASTTATPTAAANDALRQPQQRTLTVQWTAGTLDGVGPACGDPGATTPWGSGPSAPQQLLVEAPPGTARLVQIALNQVGKPYVWGAKGPETFDCSGLATWSYAQIGIRIPQGTAGQWPGMKPVAQPDLQPGDLIFFAIDGGAIDHVGIMAGDLNGDGRWDMVHAASPKLGIRIDYNIFGSAYYVPRIRGFRTAR